MRTYWLVTATVTRRSIDLEAIEKAVDHLPRNTAWRIEVQYPGGRRHQLRSGVGPPQLRNAS